MVVAKEKGFFEAEGLDITIQATPGTANAITQLASGGALFAQGAAISTVPAIANQGAGIITVGYFFGNIPFVKANLDKIIWAMIFIPGLLVLWGGWKARKA